MCRRKYDPAGKRLFEDVNAWAALSEILTKILKDPDLQNVYLIIDALDECGATRGSQADQQENAASIDATKSAAIGRPTKTP
jgi:hypothetical protein